MMMMVGVLLLCCCSVVVMFVGSRRPVVGCSRFGSCLVGSRLSVSCSQFCSQL